MMNVTNYLQKREKAKKNLAGCSEGVIRFLAGK
jgi:hypothetical protein